MQSSKQQWAKFEYITSVLLSSNLSALLLLSKLLVNRVRLIEGKAAFKTAFKEMVQNQKKLQATKATEAAAISAQLKNAICIQPKLRIKALLVLDVLCSSPTNLH